MNEKLYTKITRKTNILSTRFTDGMVVDESDLTTAQQYPVDLFSTLFQAYFGCGIVCGFDVTLHPPPTSRTDTTHCIKVHPGTAIDCHGYPFRLCKEVIMKFEPEPCPQSSDPIDIFIAVRRKQEGEQGREVSDDKCGSGQDNCQHSRMRDMVVVKAFPADKLPKNLCRITQDHPANPQDSCACRKDCPCDCCGKSWVLLARLEYIETECQIRCIDKSKRRYVKPIHCHCDAERDACADLDDVSFAQQDLSAQMMVVTDNYNQLNRNIGRQQEQLSRWGEELQQLQQAWFDQQQAAADDALDDVKDALEVKQKPAQKGVAKKKVAKKKPGGRDAK